MDNNLDILPSALFSPSKAAQQRAQAQDWHHVDTWLASKYQGRSVPTFERNEQTLKAFLALVAANEKADEERELLWSIQKEALAELKRQKVRLNCDSQKLHVSTIQSKELTPQNEQDPSPTSTTAILTTLTSSLTAQGRSSLEALSSASTTLDSPSATPAILAQTILSRTQTSQTLSQTLLRLTHLQRRLENELISLRAQLQELRSPAFQTPLPLQRQTLEWNRNTKQLRTKIGEYNERLAAVEGNDGGLIEEVVRREKMVLEMGERVRELEGRVDAFKGLPKDRDEARREVEKVGKELGRLQRKRDRMFEGLVEKG